MSRHPVYALGERRVNGKIGVLALVGTRKGLFRLEGNDARREWSVEGPLLDAWGVYHAVVDPRSGAVYAAANHYTYGPTVQYSRDSGKSWKRSRQITLPAESGMLVNATWHIAPGRADESETLYLGGDPAVLFRSDDGGASWQPNRGILEHATREHWLPGAGGLCCHSIQLDPTDPLRMYVAITTAGTFRTDDGGETWMPCNRGVAADFLPQPYPEVGQCVHKLLLHPSQSERLWQQNHCGTYRSDDAGESWERVDGNGLPSSFGFPVVLDPNDPDCAYVIPEKSMEYHYPPDDGLRVYRTRDKGETWQSVSTGLPERSWTGVLREATASDAESVYFGTTGGSFYALTDGEEWVEAVRDLPAILSVEVTEWPS